MRSVSAQSDTVVTTFRYDGAGNRIEKRVVTNDTIVAVTRYLREASGNVMAIYQDSTLQEQPIYGSNRLGQYQGGAGTACLILGTEQPPGQCPHGDHRQHRDVCRYHLGHSGERLRLLSLRFDHGRQELPGFVVSLWI